MGGGSAFFEAGTHSGHWGAKSSQLSQPGQPGQGLGSGAGPGEQPAGVSQGSKLELDAEALVVFVEGPAAPPLELDAAPRSAESFDPHTW